MTEGADGVERTGWEGVEARRGDVERSSSRG